MKPLSLTKTDSSSERANSQEMVDTPETRITILYVEDDPDNRHVATLRFEKSHNLYTASNSQEACSFLAKRGKELDVILMDIELQNSDMNGIILTRLIRGTVNMKTLPEYASAVPRLDVPIIFVTAYGDVYEERQLIAAGGDLVIRKPVNFVSLRMAMTEICLKRNKIKLEQMRTQNP